MRLELKCVYNPLKSDFDFTYDGEPYLIPAESIWVNVGYLVNYAARKIAERVLEDKGEEDPINSPKKDAIIEDLLSHDFEIIEKGASKIVGDAPTKKGGK